MRGEKKGGLRILAGLLLPVALAAVLLFFATALDSLNRGQGEEARRQLEETLRRSCVACYAAEGSYPPNLAYLEEHYGLQIEGGRYQVHYTTVAENLMPDITVLERQP